MFRPVTYKVLLFSLEVRSFPPVPPACPSLNPLVHLFTMDSIPQELIDAIIDNVPQSSLPSCSLVAKRWRLKSQQRVLGTISFSSEGEVKRWCTDIPQDSNGISSYVRHVKIEEIYSWVEPELLNHMLRSLSLLTTLSMFATQIPDELPGHISRGEFGKGITTLDLCLPYCTLATLASMILSLPDLKKLRVEDRAVTPEGPPPTHSVTPQRGPLDSLELRGRVNGIGEALAKFRFTSRRLSLGVDITGITQLLLLSSEMVVELKLCGVWFCSDRAETIMTNLPDVSAGEALPPIHLPSFPALTTLIIYIYVDHPSPRLTNILCSIGSAPALTSIFIEYSDWIFLDHLPLADRWVDVDRWLSQIAKHAKVEGGLPLTLRRWTVWEGFLPEFRESGGRIQVDNSGWRSGTWKFSL